MRGEPLLYPDAVTALIRDYLHRVDHDRPVRKDPLTPGELEVVKLIAEGSSSKQIAEVLVMSEKTVDGTAPTSLRSSACGDRVE